MGWHLCSLSLEAGKNKGKPTCSGVFNPLGALLIAVKKGACLPKIAACPGRAANGARAATMPAAQMAASGGRSGFRHARVARRVHKAFRHAIIGRVLEAVEMGRKGEVLKRLAEALSSCSQAPRLLVRSV